MIIIVIINVIIIINNIVRAFHVGSALAAQGKAFPAKPCGRHSLRPSVAKRFSRALPEPEHRSYPRKQAQK